MLHQYTMEVYKCNLSTIWNTALTLVWSKYGIQYFVNIVQSSVYVLTKWLIIGT